MLQQIIDDFTYLRNIAWSVSQGLDAFMASASSGEFEGATADAFRNVISGRLKTFVYNVARAFSLAGEAVAEYRLALVAGQQAVATVAPQATGLAPGNPKLARLTQQVQDQVDQVNAAAQMMERALRDASDMVSQPIKVPSLWNRIRKKLELALSIVAGGLALLSMIVDGPIGIALAAAAWTAGATDFAMTAVDYAQHRTTWKDLLLAGLGLLMPGGRGRFSMESLGAGARALVNSAAHAFDMMRSPAKLAEITTQGGAGLSAAALRGLVLLPPALWRGALTLPSVVGKAPYFLRDVWAGASAAVKQDFVDVMKRYPRPAQVAEAMGFGKITAYGIVALTRMAGALFTPMTFHEMATLGFRGAWASLRNAASWSEGLTEFRAGWAGYTRRGATSKGLGAAGPHGADVAGWYGGRHEGHAVLRELELPPVVFTLHEEMQQKAGAGAAVIAAKRGDQPLLGLPEGTLTITERDESPGTKLWLPQSARGAGLPQLELRGVPMGKEQRSPLVPVQPGRLSLPERHLNYVAQTGHIPTHTGVLVPITSVFAPKAVQILEQVAEEGPSVLLRERLGAPDVLSEERMAVPGAAPSEPRTRPGAASGVRETLALMRPEPADEHALPSQFSGAETPVEVRLVGAAPVETVHGGVLPGEETQRQALLGELRVIARPRLRRNEFTLEGSTAALERFRLGRVPKGMLEDPRVSFTVIEQGTGIRFHYHYDGSEARQTLREVPVSLGRWDLGKPVDGGQSTTFLRTDVADGRIAEVVDMKGVPLAGLQVETLDGSWAVLTRADTAQGPQLQIVTHTDDGRVLDVWQVPSVQEDLPGWIDTQASMTDTELTDWIDELYDDQTHILHEELPQALYRIDQLQPVTQEYLRRVQEWLDKQEPMIQKDTPELITWLLDNPAPPDLPKLLDQQVSAVQEDLLAASQMARFWDIRRSLNGGSCGLLQPHAADQRALEDALPRDTDGRFKKFPNPFDHWFELVNDGGFNVPGRASNCVDTTRAALETWYGNPQVSAQIIPGYDAHGKLNYFFSERGDTENIKYWLGTDTQHAGPPPKAYEEIAEGLLEAGPGSSAFITVMWSSGSGHAFLAVNHEGKVVWGDAQSRIASEDPIYPQASSVWYAILDATRKPTRPTDYAVRRDP